MAVTDHLCGDWCVGNVPD